MTDFANRDPIQEENISLEKPISLRGYRDLEDYGIEFLTGEACAMGQRKLFDLTREGARHVERFFGGAVELREGSNTNPGATASILLTSSVIPDLALNIVWSERPDADWLVRSTDGVWTASPAVRKLSSELAEAKYHGKTEELMENVELYEQGLLGDHGFLGKLHDNSSSWWVRGQGQTTHPRQGDKNVHSMLGTTTPA